jgi:hypothetical protein
MAEGMRLKTKTNIDEVYAKLDAWGDAIRDKAAELALNRLGDRGEVAGKRAIRQIYGLTIEALKKYMTVEPANSSNLEFKIVATGVGFPLSLFIVGSIPKNGRGPVRVRVKGRTFIAPHAFMFNGQVYARGSYGGSTSPTASQRSGQRGRRKRPLSATGRPLDLSGRDRMNRLEDSIFEPTGERWGRFAFGRNRFPITLLRTTSPPKALMNTDVVDAINERIAEQTPSVMKWAIAQALRS